MSKEIRVPTLGESVTEATVAAWLKNRGDAVAADEIVCELETDKVNVEVPAPVAGVLGEILAPVGTRVEVGALIATVTAGTAPAKASKTDKPVAEPVPEPKSVSKPSVRNPEHAPSAKRLLSEAGLSPDQVDGTGRDGRIMKADVLRAIESLESPPTISVSPAIPADGEERVRMTGLRQTIARRLKEAQNTAAMLTTYNEVDMARVIELRRDYKDVFERKHGVKLGFMPFFVKACCSALLEVPEINAEIDGTEIIYKRYVHMGIAVGTPTGLVVPVLRDAHSLGFAEIEKGIAELGTRARGGKLSVADMQGGTFSISNGGVYGSLMSSPILNPPQSGILGMHAIQDRPVARDGEIVIRPMMYLALSYDHRIVDGKGAVTFLVRVRDLIQDPRRLLMEV